jgi:hypothetical protein
MRTYLKITKFLAFFESGRRAKTSFAKIVGSTKNADQVQVQNKALDIGDGERGSTSQETQDEDMKLRGLVMSEAT